MVAAKIYQRGRTVWSALAFSLLVWCCASTGLKAQHFDLSDEARQQAQALLPALIAATQADAHVHMERLEKQLAVTSDAEEKSELLKELMFHAIDIGQPGTLKTLIIRAHDHAALTGDEELKLAAQLGHATWLALQGQFLSALEIAHKARTNAAERGDTLGVFYADAVIALQSSDLGIIMEGLATLSQGIADLPDTPRGNRIQMMAHLVLGYIYSDVDAIEDMVGHYAKALALHQKHGTGFDRESILFNLGNSLSSIKENTLARAYFEGLELVIEQTGRENGRFHVLYGLAWIAYDEDRLEDCIALANRALGDYIGDPAFDGALMDLTAISYARLGDATKARHWQQEAKAFYQQRPDLLSEGPDGQDLLTTAYILTAEGRYEEAINYHNRARRALLDAQYSDFKSGITGLRTSLEAMLAHEQAERALAEAEEAFNNLVFALGLVLGLAGGALILMQRRHNLALMRGRDQAETANKTKSEFLANMSHELRTPLNAILGFSEMMQHEVFGKLGAKQYKEYVGHIHESGRLLLDIINDILDLSKIESGRLALKEQPVELWALMSDVSKLIRPRAEEKSVTLHCDCAHNLPLLHADKRLIKQILLNILSNAVKFTEQGGRIDLTATIDKKRAIRIVARDTGIGMTEEEIAIALTPFGQAGSTMTRSHEGTGLGLPLVQSLVELHGGRLHILSEPGKGTTITVLFPPERTLSIVAKDQRGR